MQKRKHHYVWQYYLKSWTIEGQIWCRYKGKVFSTSLTNIANERDLYKINDLSNEEIQLLKGIFLNNSDYILSMLNKRWIDIFYKAIILRKLAIKTGITGSLLKQFDKVLKNFEEDLHGKIETTAIKYIDSIKLENIDFYNNQSDRASFLIFICTQYFRTSRFRNIFYKISEKHKNVNFENIWNIIVHIMATNMSYGIFREIDKYRLVLLKNVSSIELITGDQPVINTMADYTNPDENLSKEQFELYYPQTPKIGLLLTKENRTDSIVEIDENKVKIYNKLIYVASDEQIYSIKRGELDEM